MSVDRKVELRLSVPDQGPGGMSSGLHDDLNRNQSRREPADPRSEDSFQRALKGGGSGSDVPPPADMGLMSAFSLVRPAATLQQDSATEVSHPLNLQLDAAAQRLMVSDDESGNKQVRIELKDGALSGVSVVIQEAEGRIQVDFICSEEASRLQLNGLIYEQAGTLAKRLNCDVLMRVQTDDDEDPCLVEAVATP